MLNNQALKIGGKIDIQTRYKIIQVKFAKEITNLYIPPCFQGILFCNNFAQKQQKKLEGLKYPIST